MELEEMKLLWQKMSADMEKQKKITADLVIKMTRANYRNRLSKIIIPEAIGSLVCFAMVLVIAFNFQQLHSWYMVACGVVAIVILILSPVLSFRGIYKMKSLDISNNNYRQSISQYAKGRMQFMHAQKLSFYLGPLLMLAVLPVMGQIIGGKDFFKVGELWFLYVILFLFFLFFARWVFRHYSNTTMQAENLLKELEE